MMARPKYKPVDNAALRHADFRDYTAMLRGSAKLRDSILVARGLPPIGLPSINDNVKRAPLQASPFKHDCVDCGTPLNNRKNRTGRCLKCVHAYLHPKRRKCAVCEVPLNCKNRSGRCKEHRVTRDRTPQLNDTVRAMIATVAPQFDLTGADIIGQSRIPAAVEARCVIAMALRRRGLSLHKIGIRLGREHSSIKHLIEKFPEYADRNPVVAHALEALA
jgi:hypothetical protein